MEAIAATPLGDHPPSPWQDLPPELLGLVIQRVPSHASRVRAVCRSWRAGARLHPPLRPLLPWLTLCDGRSLSLPDGELHRIRIPDDISRIMSTGGMLFIVHSDGRCSLANPFSHNTAPQQVHANCFRHEVSPDSPPVCNLRKVVVMADHIVTIREGRSHGHGEVLSIRDQRQPSRAVNIQWTPPLHIPAHVLDITLFQEKLHVLVGIGTLYILAIHLYVMDTIGGGDGKHVNLRRILVANEEQNYIRTSCYLVASGDRLLMVKQMGMFNGSFIRFLRSAWFEVFEAADLSSGCGQWKKVDRLMGRALFVSQGCSESLPTGDQYGGAQQDCIYFLSNSKIDTLPGHFSGIYNMRLGTLSPLLFETLVAHDGPGTTSWLFPVYT
ncbi:uncharacterized protein [Lolium perenne]|uniref:uncharacterized protein n=1 Tax=Lolium perenne TaxID=4522 RepID=UPI0021F65F98|nr:uncharacterized protein LOC127322175 [Lolium perenne]